MLRKSFNYGWMTNAHTEVLSSIFGERHPGKEVILPYDSLLDEKRTPDAPGGAQSGFYPLTNVGLIKEFDVPADWEDKLVVIEFGGVYSKAMVFINGDYAGGCVYGYDDFYVEANRFLKFGEKNEIHVTAGTDKDTRWYSGCGIYRGVNLLVSDLVHIVPESFRISTPEIGEDGTTVVIEMDICNRGHRLIETVVITDITNARGESAAKIENVFTAFPGETRTICQRVFVENAHRWDLDDPYLYTAATKIMSEALVLDEDTANFGIRRLQLDPKHGFRINGRPEKLRGACIHHENGILGAAEIERAVERKIQILKEAGFNAVRSAHQPMGRVMLDVCDREGMLVMDELADSWTRCKNENDFAHHFPMYWKEACQKIVAKDFNHPCVVMYSIGNEIPECGTPNGADFGKQIAERLRALDASRYTTIAVNPMFSIGDSLRKLMPKAQDGELNDAMTGGANIMDIVNTSSAVTEKTREIMESVDVCGYNYASSRYVLDGELFPNRVLVGSETTPMSTVHDWPLIAGLNHVIGEFTWTGWDYLGESGVGKIEYLEDGATPGFKGAFPWHLSRCGDVDITGVRRPMSYYREMLFGLRKEPYAAIDYPWDYGKTPITDMWTTFEAINSWSWDGYEGKQVVVNVFGLGTRFEIYVNQELAGSGTLTELYGKTEVTYQSGELEVIIYDDQEEAGRTVLKSAQGTVSINLVPDREIIYGDDRDLCYVDISMMAENGMIHTMTNCKVQAAVSGAGILAGFGSACPKGEERFRDGEYTTYHGRLQAIIRPTGVGEITLRVEAEGFEAKSVTIKAVER